MDSSYNEDEKKKVFCIGIDLGTTQSSIAQLLPQGTVRIFAPDNSCSDKLSLSSTVLIQPENADSYHLYICDDFEQANARLLLQNTKFLLGSNEDEVKYMDLDLLFPKQQIVSRPNGSIAVIAKEKKPSLFRFKKPRNQYLVTPEQVAEKLLQTLLQQALSQVPEEQRQLPWNIALCVPVRYTSKQRAIIKDVLFQTASKIHEQQKGSPELQIELVDEPVAAAMSFFYEPEYSIYKREGAVVLVIDCGGGTTDVAIVTYQDGGYTVLACDGDNYLGGRNVDEQLVKHFQREFGGKLNIQKLKYKCERVKRNFSQGAQVAVVKMKGVEKEISRQTFEKIAGQFNTKVTHVLRSVLRQLAKSLESNKKKTEEENPLKHYKPPYDEVLKMLDCVVLVGGTSNLIHFQEAIEKFLKALAKREIPCFKLRHPELSVVKGAAIKASGVKVCSRTSVALGFELWNGTMHTVLPLGTPLPASNTVTIRPTKSGDVVLRIVQGQTGEGKCYLGDLVMPREQVTSQSKWLVRFSMNLDMILQVELETDTEKKVLELSMAKSCGKPLFVASSVDIVFVVDTTGSMQRSIQQCLETIESMISKESNKRDKLGTEKLRVGFVAYRDHDIGSEFVTNAFPLTEDLEALTKWIKVLDAKGGHDVAEAIADGLSEAAEFDWRPDALKLLFLIADAPPHGSQYHIQGMKNSDLYPSGCPCGVKEEEVLKVLAEKGVQFHAIKVKKRGLEDNMLYLDRMVDIFKKEIEVESHELEKDMHLSTFVKSAIDVVSVNQECES